MVENSSEQQGVGGYVRANVNRNVITPADLPEFYANDTQVQSTPWDVRFMFGLLTDVDLTTGQVVLKRIADVRISLQHAKRVAAILTELIRQHEATIGYLAIPEESNASSVSSEPARP